MEIELLRYSSQKEDTLGLLFVNCEFVSYTIEDEFRTKKIYGETRIPDGEYDVVLKSEGGFHNRYLAKFGENFHKGMLCITNAPDYKLKNAGLEFQHILIHIGNRDEDTAGCILVGNTAEENITDDGNVGSSTLAYKRIYPPIRDAILKGEKVTIKVVDNII